MSAETIHVRDWPDAPVDATHALLRPGAAISWLKLEGPRAPACWWRRTAWVQDVNRSCYWLADPQVVPRVYRLPAEAV